MRKGTITHIDFISGKGYIEDENEQDIAYHLNVSNHHIKMHSKVSFEITFGDEGLIASQIILISEPLATEENNIYLALNALNDDIKDVYAGLLTGSTGC